MKNKIFTHPFSRRQFLSLSAGGWLSLPFLPSLMIKELRAQAADSFDLPFVIHTPFRFAVHGIDFFGDLPDPRQVGAGWEVISERCMAKDLNQLGGNISAIFSNLPQNIINQMTMIAGTYNGYKAGAHDFSLTSTLYSTILYQKDGSKSPGFFDRPSPTMDQRIQALTGIKILNATYLKSAAGDVFGKTPSCNGNGILSTGQYKLDTLSTLIFGAPGGGGGATTGGGTGGGSTSGGSTSGGTGSGGTTGNPTDLTKERYFEFALKSLQELKTSTMAKNRLSKTDRNTLEVTESQLVAIRDNYKVMEQNLNLNNTNLGYDSNVGQMALEDCQTVAQSNAYLDGLVNMMVAAVVTGQYHWVNLGSFAHFLPQFSDGIGYDKKLYVNNASHEPSHNYNNNSTDRNHPNVALLRNYHRRAYDLIYSKLVDKLASIDHPKGGKFIDHGLVQFKTEHCSGNFHDTGAKSAVDNPYFGLPTIWFGGLKGHNSQRSKLLDFRYTGDDYRRPLCYSHFLGTTIFNAFGITQENHIKTSGGDYVGYYDSSSEFNKYSHPGKDPNFLENVRKNLKQMTS